MRHRPLSGHEVDELDDSVPPISAASAAGIFAEGSRFGAYVVGPCIGHGGMARIYRAEHEGLKRQVALKVLTDGVAPGTEGRARFLREARIAAAIKHPNVVNIFDIGVENRVPYMVMELLVGQDLEALLRSHGALSETTIVDIIIPVVAGLVAVHDAGVVHRDLKPGNIFLAKGANDEVEPKLLDFGISKARAGERMRLTATQGLLMGTPLYMSPEAMVGVEMTALSDQYSLGVVLYECATGINPFVADSVAETARRVTTGDYPPLSEHAIRPSRRLATIIERAMSLDPNDRYPDMRALGQDLLTLAGQRTRITWGLTFGEVAAAARARHALAGGEPGGAPDVEGQPSWRWPLMAALAVGVASIGLVATWSARRVTASSARPPSAAYPVSAAESNVRSLKTAPARTPNADPTGELARPIGEVQAPPTGVLGDRVREPTRVTARAVSDQAEDEGTASRRSRPRPPRAARIAPPVELPDAPDWVIERTSAARRTSSPSSTQLGTNDAPIFD